VLFFRGGPLPPGSWFPGGFQTKNPEEEDHPQAEEQPLKLINSWGCPSRGVLFLWVLGLETIEQGNSPRRGVSFDQSASHDKGVIGVTIPPRKRGGQVYIGLELT